MSDPHPKIRVGDLSRPPGAAVDAHGEVTCVTCGKHLPVGEADIVGLGYRCAACSETATADDDVAANVPPAERSLLQKLPSRRSLVVTGVGLLALAAIMWIAKWDITWRGTVGPNSLFVYVVIAACACFGVATAPR